MGDNRAGTRKTQIPPPWKPGTVFTDRINGIINLASTICTTATTSAFLKFYEAKQLRDILRNIDEWAMQGLKALKDNHITELMSRLIWIRGQALMTVISKFPKEHSWYENIRGIMQKDNITNATQYTWKRFNAVNIVYVKCSLEEDNTYIGMTKRTMTIRELGRLHKVKQIQKGKDVHAEPAVRWWAKKRNMDKYIPLVARIYKTDSTLPLEN